MTGDETYSAIRKAAKVIMDIEPKIRLRPDKRRAPGNASTFPPGLDGILTARIGVEGLKGNTEIIPDGLAGVAIVAVFHEGCGHGFQWLHEFNKHTPLTKALAANCVACACSECYYGYDVDENPTKAYFAQPFEIAAEYSGTLHARRFLAGLYGLDRADELIVAGAAWRRDNDCSYLPNDTDISSVDTILDSFKDYFRDRVHGQREYVEIPQTPNRYVIDAVADFKQENPQIDVKALVEDCTDGLLQDVRVAAIGRWRNAGKEDVLARLFGSEAVRSLGISDDKGLLAALRADAVQFHTWPEAYSLSLERLRTFTREIDEASAALDDGLEAQP